MPTTKLPHPRRKFTAWLSGIQNSRRQPQEKSRDFNLQNFIFCFLQDRESPWCSPVFSVLTPRGLSSHISPELSSWILHIPSPVPHMLLDIFHTILRWHCRQSHHRHIYSSLLPVPGVEIPKPTAQGISFTCFTSLTIPCTSDVISDRSPVTPIEETQ